MSAHSLAAMQFNENTQHQTIIVPCHHAEYCFRCMRIWTTSSTRCPICVQPIDHLVHRIDPLTKDFQTFYPLPIMPSLNDDNNHYSTHLAPRQSQPSSSQPAPSSSHTDNLVGIDRRRFIYHHSLYVKHIPSNKYTKFRPISSKHFLQEPPKHSSQSTQKYYTSAKLIKRTTHFLQRELRALPPHVLAHPIDHCIRVIIIILHRVDSNSTRAVRLLSELIRDHQLAQHFSQ